MWRRTHSRVNVLGRLSSIYTAGRRSSRTSSPSPHHRVHTLGAGTKWSPIVAILRPEESPRTCASSQRCAGLTVVRSLASPSAPLAGVELNGAVGVRLIHRAGPVGASSSPSHIVCRGKFRSPEFRLNGAYVRERGTTQFFFEKEHDFEIRPAPEWTRFPITYFFFLSRLYKILAVRS